MSKEVSYLVVGASRGLGLEWVRQLLELPNTKIYATARSPSKAAELKALADTSKGRVVLISFDLDDESGAKAAAEEIKKHTDSLDNLILNAGINTGQFVPVLEQSLDDLKANLHTNVIGNFLALQAFVPLILASKATKRSVVVVSTGGATIKGAPALSKAFQEALDVPAFPFGVYAASKAALNNLSRHVQIILEPQGVNVLIMSPGWVATEMGGPKAPVTVVESVKGQLKRLEEYTAGSVDQIDSFDGQFYDF